MNRARRRFFGHDTSAKKEFIGSNFFKERKGSNIGFWFAKVKELSAMKGVIFDLGHTLMDFVGEWDEVERLATASLLEFLRENGFENSKDMAKVFALRLHEGHLRADVNLVEHTAVQALEEMFEKFNVNGKRQTLSLEALERYFRAELETWNPFPDSVKVLSTLKERGYHVGLISNASHHPFIVNCLHRFGFMEYLDPVISSAAFHRRKPHPDIFKKVVEEWNIPAKEIAMVGDQLYYDVYGAHQVGMKGVWFGHQSKKAHTFIPEELKDHPQLIPDKTIQRLSELLDWLK